MERWILAIADDLTGALEVGAKFAGHGFTTNVTTGNALPTPGVSVHVIDTETRHLPEEEAAAIVYKVAAAARDFAPWLVYKKTDSTLRGNIAAEFRALLKVFPERRLVYAPAYPEMGRVVRGGRLLVDGVPVHQSAFATDLLNPIHQSDIAVLLGDVPAVVLDGESSADVRGAARAVLAEDIPPIVAGPAALAGALAECSPMQQKEVRALPRLSRCLVVNGSLHPASVAQVDFARMHGCFENGWRYFDGDAGGAGLDRAVRTGEYVRHLLESSAFEAVIVFGGDTAFGLHRALGAPPFDPYGEIVPGVPLSRCSGLFWITKAGGFGAPSILCDIRRRLT